MKKIRGAVALATALLLMTGIQACSTNPSTGNDGKAVKSIPITISYQINIVAPFFLAKETKLFEKNGLTPKFIKFESGPAQQAAITNQNVDVGELGTLPFISNIANGAPFTGIMVSDDVSGSNGLVVQAGSGIKDAADLRGKTIGVTKGSASYYGLLKALQKENMTISDVQFKDLQPAVLLSAFQHKDIDAAWVWAPWLQKLEDMDGTRILTNEQVGAPSPSFWVANSVWLKKNPVAAARFVKTMSDAASMIAAKPSVAVKSVRTILDISEAQALTLIKGDVYLTAKQQVDSSNPLGFSDSATGGINPTLQEVGTFLKGAGTIKVIPTPEDMIDNSAAKAAAGM
jgi:aliphatic sulfonates family ABC transporter substrate-binding protein